MQHCPNCGGEEHKIIAAILERPVIEKILTHLGLDPQPPPRGWAREAGQAESHLSCAGRHKHLAPGCNAKPQPQRPRPTRQRGTNRIRVNPEEQHCATSRSQTQAPQTDRRRTVTGRPRGHPKPLCPAKLKDISHIQAVDTWYIDVSDEAAKNSNSVRRLPITEPLSPGLAS
jgi:hypothetical protein